MTHATPRSLRKNQLLHGAAALAWSTLLFPLATPRTERVPRPAAVREAPRGGGPVCCCAQGRRGPNGTWLPADECASSHGACVVPDHC